MHVATRLNFRPTQSLFFLIQRELIVRKTINVNNMCFIKLRYGKVWYVKADLRWMSVTLRYILKHLICPFSSYLVRFRFQTHKHLYVPLRLIILRYITNKTYVALRQIISIWVKFFSSFNYFFLYINVSFFQFRYTYLRFIMLRQIMLRYK